MIPRRKLGRPRERANGNGRKIQVADGNGLERIFTLNSKYYSCLKYIYSDFTIRTIISFSKVSMYKLLSYFYAIIADSYIED